MSTLYKTKLLRKFLKYRNIDVWVIKENSFYSWCRTTPEDFTDLELGPTDVEEPEKLTSLELPFLSNPNAHR